MASHSELALMTKLLDIEGMKVKNYSLIAGIGVLIYLESQEKKVVCPRCGKKTDKLHSSSRIYGQRFTSCSTASLPPSQSSSPEMSELSEDIC